MSFLGDILGIPFVSSNVPASKLRPELGNNAWGEVTIQKDTKVFGFDAIVHAFRGYDVLQPLIDDKSITDASSH